MSAHKHEQTRYPEHEKLKKVQPRSQACGEFVDWLQEKGIKLAEYVTPTWQELGYGHEPRSPIQPRLVPVALDVRKLLPEFFKIDEAKLEQEKRAMLDALRAASAPKVRP